MSQTVCNNCQESLPERMLICPACGMDHSGSSSAAPADQQPAAGAAEGPAPRVCGHCQSPLSSRARFCSRCGRQQPDHNTAPAPQPGVAAGPGLAEGAVARVVQSYVGRLVDDHLYVAPDIPQQKLENARSVYAPVGPDEAVLLLVDMTVFGSAKDGLVLSDQHIFYRRTPLDRPRRVPLAALQTVRVEDAGRRLYINELEEIYLPLSKTSMCALLAELLQAAAAAYQPPAGPDAQTVLQALQRVFEAGLLTEQEYQAKRQLYLQRRPAAAPTGQSSA